MVRLRPLVDRGYLTVDILDENGYLIKNVYGGIVLGGDYTNWWDGTDGEGEPASPGRYMIRARWVVGEVTCEDILEPISVIKVESIEPDPDISLEIDDQDGNPDTRTFVVSVTNSGIVTVTADLDPDIAGGDLPDCMTLVGGDGTDKLQRTLDRATASKTIFTFDCCGSTSPKVTTVYVYDAKLNLYADEGNGFWDWPWTNKYGHSWWSLEIDSQARELVHPDLRQYLTDGGYWPSTFMNPICPGEVRFNAGASGGHPVTGSKLFQITFDSLEVALGFVWFMHQNPTTYNFFDHNCTDVAVDVGEHADVETIDTYGVTSPKELSDWLNSH